jgi:hypothetical protein
MPACLSMTVTVSERLPDRARDGHDPLIRSQFRERWRPGQMPSDMAGRRSLVRIVDLCCAALSGQNPASAAKDRRLSSPTCEPRPRWL